MNRNWTTVAVFLFASAASLPASAAEPSPKPLRGALLTAELASADRLKELAEDGYTAAVLMLEDDSAPGRKADQAAAARVTDAGLALWYWIEIARSPQLADEHPRWMASLQGHPEWRRFYQDFPAVKADEVVKNYPWVPILYQETFDAHLARVKQLLAARPAPQGVLLNDLQGPPSACGCGNPVCRWTADYGPIKTATSLGDDAAARFVTSVGQVAGQGVQVVPVWTTECEAHDAAKEALCAGVGCYKGICWKASTRQLRYVSDQSPRIGALLLYKEFRQDNSEYPKPAGWIGHALRSFQTMPPKSGGKSVSADRLVAVLQGWDVTAEEIAAQKKHAEAAGTPAWIVAFSKIDQSWLPRIVPVK